MYHPYYPVQHPYHMDTGYHSHHLKHAVLCTIEPLVQYGLKEAKFTSYPHALREIAAIAYLMGRGYDPRTARWIVESWEINEMFHPGERTPTET